MHTYSGSCLCGGNVFEVKGDFDSFFLCHCKYCQKDTGSSHAANLFSLTAKLSWKQSESTTYNLPDSRHTKSFCPKCGSALPNYQLNGKMLVVPAGSLDEGFDMIPTGHLFVSSRAPWEKHLANVPEHEGLPPQ